MSIFFNYIVYFSYCYHCCKLPLSLVWLNNYKLFDVIYFSFTISPISKAFLLDVLVLLISANVFVDWPFTGRMKFQFYSINLACKITKHIYDKVTFSSF